MAQPIQAFNRVIPATLIDHQIVRLTLEEVAARLHNGAIPIQILELVIRRYPPPIGSGQDPFKVVFGPGDCVCTDFSNPKRLSGINLPPELYQTLSERLNDNSDSYLDADLDSDAESNASYYSYASSRSDSRSRSRRRRRSRSASSSSSLRRSRSRGGSPVDRDVVIRRRSRSADEAKTSDTARRDYYVRAPAQPTQEADNHDERPSVRPAQENDSYYERPSARRGQEDDYYYERPSAKPAQNVDVGPSIRRGRERDSRPRKGKPEPSKITWLAFGSRLGEFAVIYCNKGQYYVDGNLFDRFSNLQKWILKKAPVGVYDSHIPITRSDGWSIKLFFGPFNTYFAYDATAGDYICNIETKEFQDWLSSITEPITANDDTPRLKPGYMPHSLALGPMDVFCWICAEDFKINTGCRKMFPSLEQYLSYAKGKNLLSNVMFTTSTYLQPEALQPYFVLSTSDGVCVSSTPPDASDVISMSTTRWGAICAAKREKESKRAQRELRTTQRTLSNAVWKVNEAQQLLEGGASGARRDYRTLHASQLRAIVTDLKRIDADCNRNALSNERWRRASLADRVHLLIESRNIPTVNGTDVPSQPKPSTDSDEKELWTLLLREIRLARKIVDADLPTEVPVVEGTFEPVEDLKYVVKQLTVINEEADKETVRQGYCPNTNLADRVAFLVKKFQANMAEYTDLVRDKGNLYPVLKDAFTIIDPTAELPNDPSLVSHMKTIVKDLKRIKVVADGFRNDSNDWYSETLANKIDYMTKILGYYKEDCKSVEAWQGDLVKSYEQRMSKESKGDIKKDRALQILKDMVSDYRRRPYPPGRDLADPYV